MNWFSIFLPFLFGTLVGYGVEAQINCQINSKSNDDDDNECSGMQRVGCCLCTTPRD